MGAVGVQSRERYKDPIPHRHNPSNASLELLLGRLHLSLVHEVVVTPYPLTVSVPIR